MKSQQKFSLTKRIKSLHHAITGLCYAIKTEHNLWIHLIATVSVVTGAVIVQITKQEWLFLLFAIGLVWCTELINTAIEKVMDLADSNYNPAIKIIKDVAASAVLIASIIALVTGLLIFIPKLF